MVATPWAPKDVDELLREIADDNYGVSDDRSTALATPAIKAHNAELRKANAQIDVEMVACSDAQTLAAIEAYNAKVAACAIKAYNAKASMYEQVVQKRGQPLREGFTIVKVRAACMHVLAFPMAGLQPGRSEIARDAHACARFSQCRDGGPGIGRSREMC